MEKLSIIIPAYNEEKRIGRTLESYSKFYENLKKKKRLDFEILVVLNACRDNTLKVVKSVQKKHKNIRFLDFVRGGKGFAVVEGFKDTLKRKNSLIGFVDADMATSPESFYDLALKLDGYDGAIASRGLKDSIVTTSFKRKLTNRGFNFLVRIVLHLPYKDTQCGAKIFRRGLIEEIVKDIGLTEWAFDIDLLYRINKGGFKIREVPTVWEDKAGSKIQVIKSTIQMIASIIRLRLMYSPFKTVVRAYDRLLPEQIKIHSW